MRHIYRMYKFVKLVNEDIKSFQKDHPKIADSNKHHHPTTEAITYRFAKVNKISYNVAQDVCRDVIESNWLDVYDHKLGTQELKIFCTNKKTRQLVEGIPYFRVGLVNEWVKEYGSLLTISVSLLALMISIIALVSSPS